MTDHEEQDRRSRSSSPLPDAPRDGEGWLGKSDDDLLFEIERLPAGHDADAELLEVIQSARLNRMDDVAYLQRLLFESRHIAVKKAAEAQLRVIARAKTVPRIPKPS